LVQRRAERSSAGVASSEPPLATRSRPACVATSIRPSGMNASAVGPPTENSDVSLNCAGKVAAAPASCRQPGSPRRTC
jgi:hypothetical protein